MIKLESRWLELDIKIDGYDLIPIKILGNESMSKPYYFDIDIVTTNQYIYPIDILGKKISITINSATKKYINALVMDFEKITSNYQGLARYKIKSSAYIESLKLNRKNSVFQNNTAPQLISQLLKKASYNIIDTSNLTKPYPELEYIVQYNETDFDFLHRILNQYGIFYYFKHSKENNTIYLCDNNQTINNEIFQLSFNDSTSSKSHISHWQNYSGLTPEKVLACNIQAIYPSKNISSEIKLSKINNQQIYFDYPNIANNQQELETSIKNSINYIKVEKNYISAKSNYVNLSLASKFSINENKYLVTRINYEFEEPIDSDQQKIYKNHFNAISSEVNFAQSKGNNHQVYIAPYIHRQVAKVVGLDKSDVYTDDFGRVKIEFYWELNTQSKPDYSCWCRVSQTSAGNKRGTQWIPKIGDEVSVEFIYGENNRPIVTGSFYNSTNIEPFELPENTEKTGLTSLTKISDNNYLHHQFIFNDQENNQEIFINSAGKKIINTKLNNQYEILKNSTENITKKELVSIKQGEADITAKRAVFTAGGNSIVMDESGILLKGI